MTFDIVTVAHNERNYSQAQRLEQQLKDYADREYTFTLMDNRQTNVGFGPACSAGAAQGTGEIIGFINPDVKVLGPFMVSVEEALFGPIVITGERFGKPHWEFNAIWGCDDWVCGAAFFVTRAFWEDVGGFDSRYLWGFEETDLIRQAQSRRKLIRSISLPLQHLSPSDDSERDIEYKMRNFQQGAYLFYKKWGHSERPA